MSEHTIIFDLDGTLTDPRQGIVGCIRYALDQIGRSCPGDDVIASFIGPPLRATFSTLLATSDNGLIEKAVARYRERYEDSGIYETRVYDGIRAMLECFERKNSALFVATSKPSVYAERILKHCGLDRYFCHIYGSELDGRFDDKAELLKHMLAMEAIGAEATIMVGDRAADILAAKANGMHSIGALWGYGSQAELHDAGAERLCSSPGDLGSFLTSDLTPHAADGRCRHAARGARGAPARRGGARGRS
jgi:phosphoglycolate phosphatase